MKTFFTLAVIVGLGWLAACTAPTPAPEPQITIDGAWGAPTPKTKAGSFYMTIRNRGAMPDKLVAGKSSACGAVEFFETYQLPDGMLGMRQVPGNVIRIPSNGQVELKPGRQYLKCVDGKVDFKAGVKVPLTLVFEKSGEKTLDVEIRAP